MLTSREIRSRFVEFFQQEGHTPVPSGSLVPDNDPTLLFTTAGMVQFKDVFTGAESRPYKRAVTVQRCMRAGGKHNDLENVGPSLRHHTFFEMLGNFSFGDYFKREAIGFAWKLFTEVWEMPADRLWPTVYMDDDDAAQLWTEVAGVPAWKVTRRGAKDNWWSAGDTGPCGPSSEIFWDYHPERTGQPGHNPEDDEDSFIELWNLVFMQFDQVGGGALAPLPIGSSVDTGAGLERVTSILQGLDSNYATDLFIPILERTRELTGQTPEEMERQIASYRVIADHGRAVTFLIGDGVLPGPSERGYVLRRVLRRALRHGRLIGLDRPFLTEIAKVVFDLMGEFYPEMAARREFILRTIATEEENFSRTMVSGLNRFDTVTASLHPDGDHTLSGDEAFRLYDTYGMPRDLIDELARERGLGVDWAGYDSAMQQQQTTSRASSTFKAAKGSGKEVYQQISPQPTEFLGYDAGNLSATARVLGLVQGGAPIDMAGPGQEVEVVLDRTPFYGEGGGQIGDRGTLTWEGGSALVRDTQKPIGGIHVHYATVSEGTLRTGATVQASVAEGVRWDTMRNHTATHLLHKALRDVLGTHVQQAGSLVEPERLRFDFSQNAPISRADLSRIEQIVNEQIRQDYPVQPQVMSYPAALAEGAMALFGEKYGSEVRMVRIPGFESKELCGGTHVERTGQIGACYITSEGSIGSGVRRLEAVTGRGAVEWVESRNALIADVVGTAGAQPDRVVAQIRGLQEQLKSAQKRIQQLERQLVERQLTTVSSSIQNQVAKIQMGASAVQSLVQQFEDQSAILAEAWSDNTAKLAEIVTAAAQARPVIERRVAEFQQVLNSIAEARPVWEPRLIEFQEGLQTFQKQMQQLEQGSKNAGGSNTITQVAGIPLIVTRTDALSADALRDAADYLRTTMGSVAVVLGSVIDGKPSLVAMATPDVVQRGFHAGKLLKTLAPIIGGGGGGRPDMAQAGGRDSSRLDDALAAAGAAIGDIMGPVA